MRDDEFFNRVERALKQAAWIASHGMREERSGRFLLPSQLAGCELLSRYTEPVSGVQNVDSTAAPVDDQAGDLDGADSVGAHVHRGERDLKRRLTEASERWNRDGESAAP